MPQVRRRALMGHREGLDHSCVWWRTRGSHSCHSVCLLDGRTMTAGVSHLDLSGIQAMEHLHSEWNNRDGRIGASRVGQGSLDRRLSVPRGLTDLAKTRGTQLVIVNAKGKATSSP